MSVPFHLKPTHRAVRGYYLALAQFANVGVRHESAVRAAFDQLIEAGAGPLKWTLVREYELRRKGESSLRLDGALLDQYRLVHGCLEAKDDADDLEKEMQAKLRLGYPAIYNGFLTLQGLPPEVPEYRLGNRSALEWVIDQYRVERAKDNPDEIVSDPNRADDPEYILRLIGQVVTVSVETVKLVRSLPDLGI